MRNMFLLVLGLITNALYAQSPFEGVWRDANGQEFFFDANQGRLHVQYTVTNNFGVGTFNGRYQIEEDSWTFRGRLHATQTYTNGTQCTVEYGTVIEFLGPKRAVQRVLNSNGACGVPVNSQWAVRLRRD